jgi:hypothetical protein
MLKLFKKIDKEIVINECFNKCPFFGVSMDGMECQHPYWDDKCYENMIITHDNSKNGNVPEKCPLRKNSFTTIYKLEN